MENLNIPKTKYTLEIKFDATTGLCQLEGASYPEDALSFFKPILEWIENYIKEVDKPLKFKIKVTYVNSSSSKCFIDLFEMLEEYFLEDGNVEVEWYYEEDDDEILETGEELLEDQSFPYKLIEIEH